MSESPAADVTAILTDLSHGKPVRAEELIAQVYDQLRALAGSMLRNEGNAGTLQATALVNEAYLKLIDQSRVDWKCKSHFLAIGATIMRRLLVDHARSKHAQKRGGDRHRVALREVPELLLHNAEDVLAVDEALEKLNNLDPLQAKIVELRFYGGLTVAEVAEVLSLSKRKVEYEWEMIRAWLRRELGEKATA